MIEWLSSQDQYLDQVVQLNQSLIQNQDQDLTREAIKISRRNQRN